MWQVKIYGQIEQADLETLQSWLIDRRIKPSDLVRLGDQPWTPAQDLPELQQICARILREEQAPKQKSSLPPIPVSPISPAAPVASAPNVIPIVTRQGDAWTGFRYVIAAPGFEGRRIEVKGPSFFSFPKVLVDGQTASRGAKRTRWLVRRNDGRDAEIELRGWNLDPVPRVFLDGAEIVLERPLKPVEWIWMGISLVLLLLGGGIGGLLGGMALTINARIFRGKGSPVVRYLASAGVSVLAVLGYCIVIALLVTKPSRSNGSANNFSAITAALSPSVPIRPSDWKPLSLPEDGATIRMPVLAADRPENINFSGAQHQRHAYRSIINGGAQEFSVSYVDGIDVRSVGTHHERPSDALCLLTSANLSGMNVSLNYKVLSFGRFPAVQFQGYQQGSNVQVFGRTYLIENRLYLTAAIGKNHSLTEDQANEFLDSFSVLP